MVGGKGSVWGLGKKEVSEGETKGPSKRGGSESDGFCSGWKFIWVGTTGSDYGNLSLPQEPQRKIQRGGGRKNQTRAGVKGGAGGGCGKGSLPVRLRKRRGWQGSRAGKQVVKRGIASEGGGGFLSGGQASGA